MAQSNGHGNGRVKASSRSGGTSAGLTISGRAAATLADSTPTVLASPISQQSALLAALLALREGDFSVRLPTDWVGLDGKIADTFNDIAASSSKIASELARVGTVVGKQGKTRQRVKFD